MSITYEWGSPKTSTWRERVKMMDSKTALQEADMSLQETLAKLKETKYRRRMSCWNSSYSYREVITKIGPPFWENNNSKKGLQQTRKHLMNNRERTSRLRQCRLFLQEDRELLADCFYRKLADCFYRKLADCFYRKFEKREAKGEIGRNASQESHQGHQRQGERFGCSEDEQHFQ